MAVHASMEVAKTVLEVADMAWTAVECCHRHHHNHETDLPELSDDESLRSENQRLRLLLEKNLTILQQMSTCTSMLQNCPSDLHRRLLDAVKSDDFLNELEDLRKSSKDDATCQFPFEDPSGEDLEKAEILIKDDHDEPSWWVWVPDDIIPINAEEKSGIDNDDYIIVSEELVVDGVSNFMARCIYANPKALNLSSEELREALTKSLGGITKVEKILEIWHAGKMFCTLATWGLALASLYQGRAVLRIAAIGIHHSSKFALKAL